MHLSVLCLKMSKAAYHCGLWAIIFIGCTRVNTTNFNSYSRTGDLLNQVILLYCKPLVYVYLSGNVGSRMLGTAFISLLSSSGPSF